MHITQPYKKLMRYKKPSYVAEFGIGDEVSYLKGLMSYKFSFIILKLTFNVQSQDKNGVSLHNGVWAPLFSMAAGTCM